MGKTHTPKYRLETREQGKTLMRSYMSWYVKEYGTASDKNLELWLRSFNKSLESGGINEHVGINARVSEAKIVNQKTGVCVAHYQVPMFEVF